MRARARRIPILVTVAVGLALAGAPPVLAETNVPARFPAAGELVRAVAVRAEPGRSSRVVKRLRRFRPDHQFQIVLALSARRGRDKAWWYRLSLPGHPNGARGWVRADAVEVRPVVNRIVVRLGARRIEVRRIRDGKLMLRSVAAVGRTAPRRRAAVTSTSSRRSCRPTRSSAPSRWRRQRSRGSRTGRRNVVGIHGTNLPGLLGQAVSHGCVRVPNHVATRLRRLAPLGTPIDIVG